MPFGRVSCSVCGEMFRNNKSLRFHERQAHTCPIDDACISDDRLSLQYSSQTNVGSQYVGDLTLRESRALSCGNGDDIICDNPLASEASTHETVPVRMNEISNEQTLPRDKLQSVTMRIVDENPTRSTSGLVFCRKIAEVNNMKAVSVAGDGNCQYAAVNECLKALGRTPLLNVRELRRRVHEEIVSNSGTYEPFVDAAAGSILNYARGILGRQWGDEITLRAMASILRVDIEVIRFDCNGQFVHCIGTQSESRNTIYLTLDDRHELTAHYGALIPQQQRTAVSRELRDEVLYASERNLTNEFRCRLCDRLFLNEEALKRHNDYENVDALDNDPGNDRVISETSSDISDECFSASSESKSLADNIFKMPKTPSPAEGQCANCGRYFINLKRHIKCLNAQMKSSTNSAECTSRRTRRSIRLGNESDSDNLSDVSGDRSEFSYSASSESSSIREDVFKKPKNLVPNGERCENCGKYFKNVTNHKKCSMRLVKSNAKSSVEPVQCDLYSSRTSDVNNGSSEDQSCNELSRDDDIRRRLRHYNRAVGNTRTSYIRTDLETELNKLKKLHKPWTKSEMKTDDPNYYELKEYHDHLRRTLDCITTEKYSPEVLEVIDLKTRLDRLNTQRDEDWQNYTWSESDHEKLNSLNAEAKTLRPPLWPWAAADDSRQGMYNHARMQFLVDQELQYKLLNCPGCGVTALLVGYDEIRSTLCMDCLELNRKRPDLKKKYTDAWEKVRPANTTPTLSRRNSTTGGNDISGSLPTLNPAEQALISLYQPCVTIRRNYFTCGRKYKQEYLNLLHNPEKTWCQLLPRTDLHDRFIIIERRFKNADATKYMIANPSKVRVWLKYLFENNPIYLRKRQNGELQISEEALHALESQSELASVDYDDPDSQDAVTVDRPNDNVELPPSADMHSGLVQNELFCFNQSEHLYLRKEHALRVTNDGKIRKISDDQPREATYNPHVSGNVAFPHLYPHGEQAPADCGQHTLARFLLKKQSQFAQRTADGQLKWTHAEHGVHMMHQYARTVEMNVRAIVGWYINQHPERANVPLQSLIDAFREGLNNNDQGALDSQMPELQGIMTKIRNSREKWFSERQNLESVSRDTSDACLFFTQNCDARNWEECRRLIYHLEYGTDKMPPNYYIFDNQTWTQLVEKHSCQLSVYLYKKIKLFQTAFLRDICRIPEREIGTDLTNPVDTVEKSWYWTRAEFTQVRGIVHFHTLCKLPGVLDTSLLSRMCQNLRIVREELKYGNILDYEKAWRIIKCGLLASRYLVLFADSMSTCAFFSTEMDSDHYDESKVIDLDVIRSKFVADYIKKDMTKATNPIMRKFDDTECHENKRVEEASVAAINCQHFCLPQICGRTRSGTHDVSTERSGTDDVTAERNTCRFKFPRRNQRFTVPVLMEIDQNRMELQMLMRRTNGRVPNLQRYFLQYYRGNHDVTILCDSGHKMRYAAKYASKSADITIVLNEIIQFLEQKTSSLVPPTIKQALTQLLLADCSHRSYMSKPELAYKVMDLPQVRRSFSDVKTVAHYPRAVVIEDAIDTDAGVIELTDRTVYSSYSERCWPCTETKGDLTKKDLAVMNLREFAEKINFKWILNSEFRNSAQKKRSENNDDDRTESAFQMSDVEPDDDDDDENSAPKCRLNWRCRDRKSGHWLMSRKQKASHIKPSTILYTDLARHYVPSNDAKKFTDLPFDKRCQLKRCYQELIMYLAWEDDPDRTFLSPDVLRELEDKSSDPDWGSRYSLKRLHEYFKVYMTKWQQGIVAPPGSQWHRDNQYCYSMYKSMQHNQQVHDDMQNGEGVMTARLESVDEADSREMEFQTAIVTSGDDDQFPDASNFIAADVLEEVERQTPPNLDQLYVAYSENENWKTVKNVVSNSSENLFMARPPKPDVELEDLTPIQRHAYDLIADGIEKILYIHGKAGSGKTLIAQHLCQKFAGRCQACAATGKASANFCGPTIHGAFLWSSKGTFHASSMSPAKKQKLQNFYSNTELFIFDEINACGADFLAQIDETMKELFCRVNTSNGKRKDESFGGKKVVFLGDSAQLPPIRSAPIHASHVNTSVLRYRSRGAKEYFKNAQKGQHIYRQYLMPKCIWLQQGQRNSGLLQQIMDNFREGKQTEKDLDKLQYQRQKYPDYIAQRGIHYSNDSAALFNCRQLWDDCQRLDRHFYVSRALYHVEDNNENVVRTLSAIPPCDFGYAPNLLCLAEGCEVRLILNIDTSAGLTTNSTGFVARIVYDDSDLQSVTQGEHPAAYCIIVYFPSFHGFVSQSTPNERYFPFSNRNLVPIYRRRFQLDKIPESIRKLQARKFCYREQFPIDLSTNLTAHRGQGQTWKNCTLSVNLGFESPQNKLPTDAASIAYVACTRITKLKDLFLSPIFPSVWYELGKSERDVARRKHENELKKAAEQFASLTGKYEECLAELRFKHDFSKSDEEWQEIISGTASAGLTSCPSLLPDDDLNALKHSLDQERLPFSLKPVTHQRYIGIDQGLKNFSVVAIDKKSDDMHRVVGAFQINLQQLGLFDATRRLTEADVLLKLAQFTPLFQWIDGSDQEQNADADGYLPPADRVIVAVEQISIENAYHKQLGQNLATALQRQFDIRKCIVKMSQPHIHRKTGPMFKLGDEIIEACNLQPPSYETLQTRVDRKRRSNATINDQNKNRSRKRRRLSASYDDDVEPSDDSDATDTDDSEQNETNSDVYQTLRRQVQREEYKKKKAMSAAVFKYCMNATPAQQLAMQLEVDPRLQAVWNNASDIVKYDDLGDALLHALDSLLSNSNKYRQLIPSSFTLHRNRTIVIVLMPDKALWVVLECIWNKFVLQDMGIYSTDLSNRTFSAQSTTDSIAAGFHPRLLKAISQFETSLDCLTDTAYIKVIVKQLKSYVRTEVTGNMAGSLVNATVAAVKKIADAACANSQLSVTNNKKTGWLYSRRCEQNGKRFDVLRSSGKHLNGILSCFQWFKTNLPDFVRDRPLRIHEDGRYKFFNALRQLALNYRQSDEGNEPVSPQLESISLNNHVVKLLKYDASLSSSATQKTLSDLILIALDSNSHYVSAISKTHTRRIEKHKQKSNSRSNSKNTSDGSNASGQTLTMQICTCGTSVNCTSAKHLRLNVTRS